MTIKIPFCEVDRKDISKRPAIAEQRSRLGDWEGDTVFRQDDHLG